MIIRILTAALLLLTVIEAWPLDIVAHRGASAAAPENTLPAFKLAWELGADAVEGDFFLTADKQIVCCHDRSTKRMSGQALEITKSRYDELQRLDVGSWKGAAWKGAHIPTLEEVLATTPEHGRVFIEIKDSLRIVEPLAQVLRQDNAFPADRLAIIAFKQDVVAACKKAMPEIKVCWLLGGGDLQKLGISGVVETAQKLGADGVDIQASRELTAELARALRAADLEFHCWTVNDAGLAQHMAKLGVDSITTDRPGMLRRALEPQPELRQQLRFDEQPVLAGAIDGGAHSNAILNTGSPLPATGTVALWYRPVTWYNYQTVFDNTDHPDSWELWISAEAEIGFRTTREDRRLTHRLHPVAALNQWQHLAVTWDSRRVCLYVNGLLAADAARKVPVLPGAGSFCLGGGNSGNTAGKGSWDTVIVREGALSAQEIRSLMLQDSAKK